MLTQETAGGPPIAWSGDPRYAAQVVEVPGPPSYVMPGGWWHHAGPDPWIQVFPTAGFPLPYQFEPNMHLLQAPGPNLAQVVPPAGTLQGIQQVATPRIRGILRAPTSSEGYDIGATNILPLGYVPAAWGS